MKTFEYLYSKIVACKNNIKIKCNSKVVEHIYPYILTIKKEMTYYFYSPIDGPYIPFCDTTAARFRNQQIAMSLHPLNVQSILNAF